MHLHGGQAMRDHTHLLRILGVIFGLAAVVGSVIGQGILRSPGVVANATGSPAIIIGLWVAGALVSCLLALPFIELSAAIPRAGGPFAFIHRAYGGKVSVVAMFAMMIGNFASMAYFAIVVGEFLVRLGVGGGEVSPILFGMAVLLICALLNATGTRASGFTQIMFSSLKGVVLLALVIALFASDGVVQQATDAAPLRQGWGAFGTAIVVVLTTYAGWWNVSAYGEEIENPGRAMPRALLGGIAGVAVIYLLINLAMLHVMTPDQMAGSELVAADAAGIVLGPQANFALTCFGVLSVGAIANLGLMTYTRLTFAAARAGIFPQALAHVSAGGTPLRAMMLVVVASALLLLTGSYLALVSLGETIFLPVMIAVSVAVITLRKKEPQLDRPWRVPFYPFSIHAGIFVTAALLVVYIAQDPFYSLAGFVLVGICWLGFQISHWLRGRTGIASAEIEDWE